MARENLTSLTSLRFFAATSIVWLHAKLYFDWARIGPSSSLDHGVSFFFVLSGFILTHAHSGKNLNYWQFMKGRVARLWPMHLVCLAAVVMLIRPDSQSFDGPGIYDKWVSIIPNALLLQSWIPSLASVFSWNSVSWSISTEIFFYAMFPLMLALVLKRRAAFAVVCILPLLAAWVVARWVNIPPSSDVFSVTGSALFYSFPPSRLLEFGTGIIACKIWQRLRRNHIGVMQASIVELSAIGMMIVWFLWVHPLVEGVAKFSSILDQWTTSCGSFPVFALVIPMLASGRGVLGKVLAFKPLVFMGEASFALYMVHQIVMKVIFLDKPEIAGPALILGSCLVAAIAGHLLVERPGRRLILGVWSKPKALNPAIA